MFRENKFRLSASNTSTIKIHGLFINHKAEGWISIPSKIFLVCAGGGETNYSTGAALMFGLRSTGFLYDFCYVESDVSVDKRCSTVIHPPANLITVDWFCSAKEIRDAFPLNHAHNFDPTRLPAITGNYQPTIKKNQRIDTKWHMSKNCLSQLSSRTLKLLC